MGLDLGEGQLSRIKSLISELMGIHPSDKVRVGRITNELVYLIDQILSNIPTETTEVALGDILDELRRSQYYVFSDIVARSKHSMKINDLIQKTRFRRLQDRLKRP